MGNYNRFPWLSSRVSIALASLLFLITLMLMSSMFLSTPATQAVKSLEVVPPNIDPLSTYASALPSGWDSAGRKLYTDAKFHLVELLLKSKENHVHYATSPLGQVKTHLSPNIPGGYWFKKYIDGVAVWEPQTFETFLNFAPGHDTYVDFGSWIGPTLFFCAQLFHRSFAIEADPVAFASVSTTLQLNRESSWSKTVTLQPGAIGPGSSRDTSPTVLSLKSAKAGNSCSGAGSKVNNCADQGEVNDRWQVNSYSLPALLKHWEVVEQYTFIKVDVESFECALVPSWLPWLETLREKPTFYISFHSYVVDCADNEYQQILNFAKLFRMVLLDGKEVQDELTESFQRFKGLALLFTDKML